MAFSNGEISLYELVQKEHRHFHPSGDLTPSSEDINITERLKETGHLLGIPVLDHLIINGINMSEIYSFKTHGVLETPKT